jgi:hypothetical protein
MSVDGGVTSCSCQVLSFTIWNVFSVSLNVPLCESEIDEEYFVGCFVESHTEVVGFDVSVDEFCGVEVVDDVE